MNLRATAQFRPRSDLGRFVDIHVSPAVRLGMQEVCAMIEQRAKELCPVDTGALQASISTEIEDVGRTIRGTVAPHMYYAGYVEFGTGIRGAASAGAGEGPYSPTWPGMPASPYLRPALDESRAQIESIFADSIASGIST